VEDRGLAIIQDNNATTLIRRARNRDAIGRRLRSSSHLALFRYRCDDVAPEKHSPSALPFWVASDPVAGISPRWNRASVKLESGRNPQSSGVLRGDFHRMESGCRLEAVNLEKRYGNNATKLTIFKQLHFVAEPGEKLALVGESGAGKSTLLYLLGGLDRPTSGQILYEGTDITQLSDQSLADFRNRTLGFVWQTHYLLPEFTALENVSMPLRIRGVDPDTAHKEALERLREVGLEARAHHLSGELSGGEQQRVVLARALIGRPKVLLADEPTGNLDGRTGERITGLLDEMHREHGLTSVYVTHNLSFARQCDRILELRDGALVTVQ